MITGYEDGTVAAWDVRHPRSYMGAARLHEEPVMALAVAPDGRSGVSGAADDQVVMFDFDPATATLAASKRLPIPKGGIADAAMRPDGRVAATAGWDGRVRVFHCRRREPLAILRYHQRQAACVGFSSDGVLLASGGRDAMVAVWSLWAPAP